MVPLLIRDVLVENQSSSEQSPCYNLVTDGNGLEEEYNGACRGVSKALIFQNIYPSLTDLVLSNWIQACLDIGPCVLQGGFVEKLNGLIEHVRKRYGNRVIDKKGALRHIMQGLKRNDCIGILMDQAVVPEEGYVIDFLGRSAWTTKMPAVIAHRTGAAVVPAFIYRDNHGHRITIFPEVELARDEGENALENDTERFSRFIEDYIREHPTEWLWIHRRWKRVDG